MSRIALGAGFVVAAGCTTALGRALLLEPGPDVARIHWALRVLLTLVVPLIGWFLFAAGQWLVLRGKQHRAPVVESFEHLRGRRYLLYLRPFHLDRGMSEPPPEAPGRAWRSPFEMPGRTAEDFLLRQFSSLGEVVAVGQPGEELPLLGARRGYLPLDDWQRPVSALLQGAHIVLMSVAPGPGTEWEFTEALRTVAPERLVLMVACDAGEYDTFRREVAELYDARRHREGGSTWAPFPDLPACPWPPGGKRQYVPPVRAFVVFDREWRPTLLPFVVSVPWMRHAWTVRRLVRAEMRPLLDRIGGLPPRGPAELVPFPPSAVPAPAPVPRQPLLGSVHGHRQAPPGKRRR
ncbi:hypothetical protein [Streptomyces pseudogriseolus]|uniref:hypothetical protein n=1 Tax=Streptomyces pseudogriseolus TaxID=36817 RepID=UPI003FA1B017